MLVMQPACVHAMENAVNAAGDVPVRFAAWKLPTCASRPTVARSGKLATVIVNGPGFPPGGARFTEIGPLNCPSPHATIAAIAAPLAARARNSRRFTQ